jgi:hypothetical protein
MIEAVENKRPSAVPPPPAPSLRVPDHPLSTMLREGGQKTGAGGGGIEKNQKKLKGLLGKEEIRNNKTRIQRGELAKKQKFKAKKVGQQRVRSKKEYKLELFPLAPRLEVTSRGFLAVLGGFGGNALLAFGTGGVHAARNHDSHKSILTKEVFHV